MGAPSTLFKIRHRNSLQATNGVAFSGVRVKKHCGSLMHLLHTENFSRRALDSIRFSRDYSVAVNVMVSFHELAMTDRDYRHRHCNEFSSTGSDSPYRRRSGRNRPVDRKRYRRIKVTGNESTSARPVAADAAIIHKQS